MSRLLSDDFGNFIYKNLKNLQKKFKNRFIAFKSKKKIIFLHLLQDLFEVVNEEN